MPEAADNFFISALVQSLLPRQWSPQVRATSRAMRWVNPSLARTVTRGATAFSFRQSPMVPHVQLDDALNPETASAIHSALQEASFTPHHHASYPLSIARRERQKASVLTGFMDWLSTADAGLFHRWLVGYPQPLRSPQKIQVQVSRMGRGEQFPPHVDTARAEGIAVVYNFTQPWDPAWGGALCFPDGQGNDQLVIEPRFNSVFIFRSRGALHRVSPITTDVAHRFSVTAFYLDS